MEEENQIQEEETTTQDIIERELDKIEPVEESTTAEETPAEETPVETPKYEWRSWKKEAAEELSKLPVNVQDYIAERESQFHKGLEQYKEAANFAKTIDKAIAPYKEYLSQLQVTPDVAFRELIRTEKTLRTGTPQEKIEMFQKMLTDYRVDLNAVANTPYNHDLRILKDQLAQREREIEAANEFKQTHEMSETASYIEQFGQSREYFNDVRNTMADLIESGVANSLDDAYNKAIRLNDDVFNKWQTQQQSASQNTSLNQANQAAKQAKQSAVQIKGSPVGVKTQAAPKTTEDAVRMAMAQFGI